MLRCSASGAVTSTTRCATSTQVDVLEVEDGSAGVEPADLEQVGQQRLEPVELGLQELGGPRGHGVELSARVVQHVAGHPDRRERGAQLVRDVGDEPPLQPLSSSSWRIWRCRLVAIWLNEVASRARSSSPDTRSRSCSWPAARRSATRRGQADRA